MFYLAMAWRSSEIISRYHFTIKKIIVLAEIKTYFMLCYIQRVKRWSGWLRHCCTRREFAALNPDGLLEIFIHIFLDSTEPLAEKITGNVSEWFLLRIGSIGDRPVSPATWLSIYRRHNCLQQLLHVRSHSKSLSHLAHILLTSGLSRRRNYSANLVHQFRPCWFKVWHWNYILNYLPNMNDRLPSYKKQSFLWDIESRSSYSKVFKFT
jgi:hypothetical protein